MGPTAVASPRVTSPTAELPDRTRFWALTLLAGWMAQAALRMAVSFQHAMPILVPDESGYLLAARLISGGSPSDLSGRTFYQGGYSLLLAPVYWISDDPATVYRLVLVINALAGASLLVLAYLALRRMGLPRGRACLLAHVTALIPSAIYYSQFALTDAVLPVVVLGWLLLLHGWLGGGGRLHGVAASAAAAYAYSTHARGLIILVVHAGLLVVVALRRRGTTGRDVAAMALVAALGAGAGWALNSWVRAELYPGGVAPLGDWLTDRLTTLDGLAWTVSVAAGQLWHVIVATWGLAGVGLLALAATAFRRAAPSADQLLAGVTLAAIAGVAVATSAALPGEGTVANHAYGRYLACFTPALVAAGLAVLTRARTATAIRAALGTAALTAVTAGIVWLHAGESLSRDFFGVFDFPEICFLTWDWDALNLWRATVTATLLLALATLVRATAGRRTGLIAVAAACVAVELTITGVTVVKVSVPWGRILSFATDLAPAGLRPGDRVGVDYQGVHWRIWVSQAFAVRRKLVPVDPSRGHFLPADLSLVVVPWPAGAGIEGTWPAAPPGWRPVAGNQNQAGSWAAWRR